MIIEQPGPNAIPNGIWAWMQYKILLKRSFGARGDRELVFMPSLASQRKYVASLDSLLNGGGCGE